MFTDLTRALHRLQVTSVASPVKQGDKVYVYDLETLIPAYDTPRFAPLRALLSNLASSNHPILWTERHHVAVPSGGPGQPAHTIWVKKNRDDATSDVSMADFRFRFDNSKSSIGFSIESLRDKLGDVTCAQAGLEWLIVADAQPQTHGIIQGSERHPFIIAVRQDDLFDTRLWLYLDELNKEWGLSPEPPADGREDGYANEVDECDDDEEGIEKVDEAEGEEAQEVEAQEVEAQEVEAQEEVGALHMLNSVPLKIAGTLFALGRHPLPRGATREELARPLKLLGIGKINQTLEPARLLPHASWFVHNGERGAKMRLALKPHGASIINRIYEGNQDKLRAMVSLLAGVPWPPPSTTPPPAPLPSSNPGQSSDSPDAAPPVSNVAVSSAINEAKRVLEDLDAAIAKAQSVSKHLRSSLNRLDC